METLTGRVKYVHGRNAFTLFDVERKIECRVNYDGFFPIREDDAVIVQVEKTRKEYIISGNYFATVPRDRQSVVNYLFKQLSYKRMTVKACGVLYDTIKSFAGSIDPCDYIDNMAWTLYSEDDIKTEANSLVKVISPDNLRHVLRRWIVDRVQRSLWLLGFTNRMISYSTMPWHELYKKAIDNPYKVVNIPLDRCQNILEKIGRKPEDKDLCCGAAIRFVYNNSREKGWTYTPLSLVMSQIVKLKTWQDYFFKEYDVVYDKLSDGVYLKRQWMVEQELVEFFTEIINDKNEETKIEVEYTRKDLSKDQKAAIVGALSHPLSFIVGAAGTGKTTIINELISYFKKHKKTFALLAYTGKAAMRINEVTKEKASTIHMFMNDPSIYDTIIIDEVSMVTSELFYQLLKCVNKKEITPRFIFIGDPNQLLPIEAGFFLREMLQAKVLPIFELTINHRSLTEENDGIIINATKICTNQFISVKETNNFRHYTKDLDTLLKTFHESGLTPSDFVIISPYKELEEINRSGQNIFTKKNPSITDIQGRKWCVGDPVICTKNMYDFNLVNGQGGIITDISTSQIKVKFDGQEETSFDLPTSKDEKTEEEKEVVGEGKATHRHVRYLLVSYAMTVHRFQGSEKDFVVFYLPSNAVANKKFINRHLVYTAVTRARHGVFIVGSLKIFSEGARLDAEERYDFLGSRLLAALGKKVEPKKINDDDDPFFDDECDDDDE